MGALLYGWFYVFELTPGVIVSIQIFGAFWDDKRAGIEVENNECIGIYGWWLAPVHPYLLQSVAPVKGIASNFSYRVGDGKVCQV